MTAPNGVIYAYADYYDDPEGPIPTARTEDKITVPLPPAGEDDSMTFY